jgi:hypothetical protein
MATPSILPRAERDSLRRRVESALQEDDPSLAACARAGLSGTAPKHLKALLDTCDALEEANAELLTACRFALYFVEQAELSETVIPGDACDRFIQGLSQMHAATAKAEGGQP